MDRLWVRLSILNSVAISIIFITLVVLLILRLDIAQQQSLIAIFEETAPSNQVGLGISESIVKVVLFAILIGVVISVMGSRFLTNPITDLVNASRKIGAGDLDTQIKLNGGREVEELAVTFNQMAADLKAAREQRKRLMADVAHELRTPLTVLEGNLRAAIDQVYELDEADLANLYGQTRHLIRLVNDLREVTLAEAHQLNLEKKQIDAFELLQDSVEIFQPLANELNIELSVIAPETQTFLFVDEARLKQVLHNLLANALRHSHSLGSIKVSAECEADQIKISVSDTGDGIEEKELSLIFDRFAQAGSVRNGAAGSSGLGLAIARAIVEAHGGTIQATSDGLGQGSCFTFAIPI